MSDTLLCTLRARRLDAGLSQGELARQSGVSRQALIAIEAGRQVPSTSLALQLARALRCGVHDLFALPDRPALEATLAPSASSSSRVAIGRVDGTWVAHPVDPAQPGDGVLGDRIPGSSQVRLEPLADAAELENNVLVAGCAPLLGLLTGRLGRRFDRHRATWVSANSSRALELLEQGLVHVAGLHLVESHTPGGHSALIRDRFPDREMSVVNLTCWRQGLVVAPGNPLGIRGVVDLEREDVRLAHREPGAGAQALLERELAAAGLEVGAASVGRQAAGHGEVAQLIRWGVADVGIAIEAVAVSEGLYFIPLAEERFDLLVPRARLDTPSVVRLMDLLEGPEFRSDAARLPGYDLSQSGHATTVAAR